ncbi:hypothetical protein AN219_20520 [Streptomyces nanshensis]|nr:hypothetical protein AN219_20520 [Streptomyces nanshensis]
MPGTPSAGDLTGGLAVAGLRPERLTDELKAGHAQETAGKVRNTVATAHPVIDGVSGAVLPPVARGAALQVRALGYQVALDAAVTVDCASATTAPFAESTYHRTHVLAHDVTGHLGAFGAGVASDALPYAHELGTGVHGNADEMASHVVTDVRLLITAPAKRDLTDPANIPGPPVASQVPAGL